MAARQRRRRRRTAAGGARQDVAATACAALSASAPAPQMHLQYPPCGPQSHQLVCQSVRSDAVGTVVPIGIAVGMVGDKSLTCRKVRRVGKIGDGRFFWSVTPETVGQKSATSRSQSGARDTVPGRTAHNNGHVTRLGRGPPGGCPRPLSARGRSRLRRRRAHGNGRAPGVHTGSQLAHLGFLGTGWAMGFANGSHERLGAAMARRTVLAAVLEVAVWTGA